MSKVFGYSKFDENGEMILTTYDNEYKAMMMDIRVYSMKAGQIRTFKRDKEETAVLLLSGKVTYTWEDEKATVSRKDVFTEGPWALHVSGSKEITVTAEEDTEILVQCTHNDKTFAVAAIVTAFTAPIITSMCDKHMRKKKLGIYSDAAIAEREAKEKQGA